MTTARKRVEQLIRNDMNRLESLMGKKPGYGDYLNRLQLTLSEEWEGYVRKYVVTHHRKD